MQEFSVNKTSSMWGDYRENLADSQEYLTIVFAPGSAPLQQRWRKNALSADFIADYFATFCPRPAADPAALFDVAELQDQVNFIANELLENAMKFCDPSVNLPISMTLRLFPDGLVFEATNALNSESVGLFQGFIQELLSEDPSQLLLHQLEQNAADPQNTDSRLGFLTLISDYQARVGWKFEPLAQSPDLCSVTVMVYLNLWAA